MSDVYALAGVMIPVLAGFGRLMWMMGAIQARLTSIERTLSRVIGDKEATHE